MRLYSNLDDMPRLNFEHVRRSRIKELFLVYNTLTIEIYDPSSRYLPMLWRKQKNGMRK